MALEMLRRRWRPAPPPPSPERRMMTAIVSRSFQDLHDAHEDGAKITSAALQQAIAGPYQERNLDVINYIAQNLDAETVGQDSICTAIEYISSMLTPSVVSPPDELGKRTLAKALASLIRKAEPPADRRGYSKLRSAVINLIEADPPDQSHLRKSYDLSIVGLCETIGADSEIFSKKYPLIKALERKNPTATQAVADNMGIDLDEFVITAVRRPYIETTAFLVETIGPAPFSPETLETLAFELALHGHRHEYQHKFQESLLKAVLPHASHSQSDNAEERAKGKAFLAMAKHMAKVSGNQAAAQCVDWEIARVSFGIGRPAPGAPAPNPG